MKTTRRHLWHRVVLLQVIPILQSIENCVKTNGHEKAPTMF